MRAVLRLAVILLSAVSLMAQASLPLIPATEVIASPADLKKAKKEYEQGVKLKKAGKTLAALEHFEAASKLAPKNGDYLLTRELVRQAAVSEAIERGNAAMARKATIEAQADYREALRLDPENTFAQERLRKFLAPAPDRPSSLRFADSSLPIEARPKAGKHKFEYRGDSRALLTQVASAYGLTAMFDDGVQSRRVRFEMEEAEFAPAMGAACMLTKSFWVPLSATQILFFQDTAANRRDYQRMGVRTFFASNSTAPTELNDLVNVFRVIFDARFVVVQASNFSITVRAPQPLLEAMTTFFEGLDERRPQVSLNIKIYQVSHLYSKQLGTDLPLQFTTFNIGAILHQFGVNNLDELLAQLASSGALNGVNGQGLQALLAQFLQSQNSDLASLLSHPFAIYGGGLTLMGLSIPSTSQLSFAISNSDTRLLDDVTLRASHGNPASIMLGSRYPIENATYSSPLAGSPLASVLGTGLQAAAFPSVTFEDLGITFKATPAIHSDQDVRLDLELKVRALQGEAINGIPVIGNREYKSSLTLKNGETGVVAGMLERSESRAISGMPLLGSLPGLAPLFRSENKQLSESELLIVITPQILSYSDGSENAIPLQTGG